MNTSQGEKKQTNDASDENETIAMPQQHDEEQQEDGNRCFNGISINI